MAAFHLVLRSGPGVGKSFVLDEGENMIGREASCKIAVNDAEISRKHARILRQGDGYILEDLGSTNGTFVNGQRLSGSMPIKAGDLIAMGENVVLLCEADFDPDATVMSAKTAIPAAPARVVTAPKPVPVSTPAPVAAQAPAPVAEPAPAYSGAVPEGPQAPKKKSSKTLLIIIIVLVVLCICGVSLFLYFAPRSFWCSLPFIQWPAGSCQ